MTTNIWKEADAEAVIVIQTMRKLSVQHPSAYDVRVYLEKIADEHGVEWTPRVPMRVHEMYEPTRAPTWGYLRASTETN